MWTKKSHTHRLIEIANIGVHNREERDPKNLLPRLTEQATVLVTTYHLKYNTPSTTPVHLYYHGAEEKSLSLLHLTETIAGLY